MLTTRQKKLMLLGGIRYLLPVIKAAHEQGYYVITADYLPDNIAHKYSDEYVNVSIIDKDAVLKVAQEKQIDGIMSFGVDPGVVSASYVQNQIGLPSFGPFESVEILQNKDKFRAFLTEHGFNVPKAKGFSSKQEALSDLSWYDFPVIVKPTDSAGSKGVTKVDSENQLSVALDYAFAHSMSKHVIVEEFIEKKGCSSDTDCFSIDGKLTFVSFNAQRFDDNASNPFTPAAYSWPSTFTRKEEEYLTLEIQRLITLLNLKTAVYNVETRIGVNGQPYIMELTPRGGGNRLCEMLHYATGVDMITAITRAVVGDSILEPVEQKPYKGHWAEIILHADKNGRFDRIEIDDKLPVDIIEQDLWVRQGDKVESFEGANNAIGTLVLKFNTAKELEYAITHQREWLEVVVK
ncbi:acetyl-CoA carboxylase biotin carboxylase subunit family protein [Prevotella sp. Rep29]|uniref:ATP-grasp domain-containing protein n=1 Tax=Prevotella sp. Rep29 TaxID=2691580 RepID=UPI001C6E26B2|nr:ATP-grasp domain-containing protein [Prevotella sp. Rep29]QYR10287.1 ATP-grasp domain-containing protein [Prevotella sp. Rep29]